MTHSFKQCFSSSAVLKTEQSRTSGRKVNTLHRLHAGQQINLRNASVYLKVVKLAFKMVLTCFESLSLPISSCRFYSKLLIIKLPVSYCKNTKVELYLLKNAIISQLYGVACFITLCNKLAALA